MTTQPDSGRPERTRSGFPEWLYLIFLAFLFLAPTFDPDSGPFDWVLAGVIAAVTAVVYLTGLYRPHLALPGAVVLVVVGVVGAWAGTGAMGILPIYAAALAAIHVNRRVLVRRLVALTVITVATIPLAAIPMPFALLTFGPALPLIWLIGFSVYEDISLNVEAEQLRAENARIQHLATVTERERIARDLHDLAGQAFTAVALRSQLIARLADTDPGRVREEAEALETTARETLARLRETVAGWQQVGLADELDKGVALLEAAGVETEVEGAWNQDLAPSVETVLALALREAVTNVVRHARASRCRVELNGTPGRVELRVSDNGIGANGPAGSGLRGMRERVTAAAGTVELVAGRGTELRVAIPVGGP